MLAQRSEVRALTTRIADPAPTLTVEQGGAVAGTREERPAAVRDAVETVARLLARPLAAGAQDSVVRTVHASSSVYEIRGRIFRANEESVAAILVTVDRREAPLPGARTLGLALGLTRRQSDVAALLARGLNNSEVADALGISTHTARHHTEKVLQKLNLRSRQEVGGVLASVDWNMIDPGRRDAESV